MPGREHVARAGIELTLGTCGPWLREDCLPGAEGQLVETRAAKARPVAGKKDDSFAPILHLTASPSPVVIP